MRARFATLTVSEQHDEAALLRLTGNQVVHQIEVEIARLDALRSRAGGDEVRLHQSALSVTRQDHDALTLGIETPATVRRAAVDVGGDEARVVPAVPEPEKPALEAEKPVPEPEKPIPAEAGKQQFPVGCARSPHQKLTAEEILDKLRKPKYQV